MNRRLFSMHCTSRLALCLAVFAPLMSGCIADADHDDVDAADEQRNDEPLGVTAEKFQRAAQPVKGEYLVTLRSKAAGDTRASARRLSGLHRGEVFRTYDSTVRGFAVAMSEEDARALSRDPDVALVEENGVVSADTIQSSNVSWGLDRIDSRALSLNGKYVYDDTGSGVHAYIVDTGIRQSHAEFSGRIGTAYDAVTSGGAADDCYGHGTHVAGIVGGSTYGVAKGVTLHAVRVLGCSGSGTTADVVEGLEWVANNFVAPAVVNMSLGGGTNTTLDNAVQALIDKGVTVVVSGGNDNADACSYSPARAANAITVGATDNTDARAYYSNYGSCLDLFAPGSSITSAYNTNDSATTILSGTSMAAPHVTGAVAIYLQDHPTATPSSVTTLLSNSAAINVVGNEGSGSPDRLLQIGFNTVTIQTSTGHYFSADNGGGGDLDANRTSVGIWEKLNLVDTNGGSLVSGDYVYLQSYYGKFLVAESGGGSTLEANRTDPGPWETFRVWKQNGSGTIVSGDTIVLQASNGNYVSAEGGGGGEVNANRTAIGAWEKLTINFIGW